MNRPNDQRSKIGAARENKDKKTTRRDRGDERDEGPVRFPTSKKRAESPPPRRQKNSRDSRDYSNKNYDRPRPRETEGLKVIYTTLDKCTISRFESRDGSIHESDNYYEFLKKLLEHVNSTLNLTAPPGSFKLKEIRETISPASESEKKKFGHNFRSSEHMLHCGSVIVGLPPCVFFGNGFSEKQWNLAKTSAGKDMVDKIYRIGFISQRLYEFVEKCRRYDHKTKAPDFLKAVSALVCLEKRMVNHIWPRDVLQASAQPLKILDDLKNIFREVRLEIYGHDDLPPSADVNANMDPRSRQEAEIERKIAMQREEMLRRERVREMVEPLEDAPFGLPASMPPMAGPGLMPPWNGGPMRQLPMHPMGMNPMGPMMGAPPMAMMGPPAMLPPPGMIGMPPSMGGGPPPFMGPMGGGQPIMKPVDMDIDEPSPHPYRRRAESPQDRWGRERNPGLSRREEEMRKREEEERLRRKEEELERKMLEEEDRKKRQIEDEVRRRVEEELSKRAPVPMNNAGYSNSAPVHYGQSQPVDTGYRSQGDVYGGHANTFNTDTEMDEIHRLIKQTEDRLREVQAEESSLYGGGEHTALRSLVAMGENASGMTSHQKQEFISGLKNILGQSSTASVATSGDRWRSTAARDIPVARASRDEDRYVSTYHSKPKDYDRRERSRSRSRSPRRDRSPARSSRHRSSLHYDKERRELSSRDPQCAYCESYAHLSDICHKFTTPSTRKLELRKFGRCSACLLKHGGKCDYGQPCEYCGHTTHHRSICEHPDHMRKLNALRDLARAY